MTFTSGSLLHIYSLWVDVHLAYCLKSESASRRFQTEVSTRRGLLRDCETSMLVDRGGSFPALVHSLMCT